jgi:hypothetical protein
MLNQKDQDGRRNFRAESLKDFSVDFRSTDVLEA